MLDKTDAPGSLWQGYDGEPVIRLPSARNP